MSQPPPSGNIAELPNIGSRATSAKLVAGLRGVVSKRISGLISALFDSVDDALFDMAERAGNNQNQSRYFDGMREIRRKRQQAEQSFAEAVARRLADYEAGKLPPADAPVTTPSASRDALTLVDESELEESLAITAMVDKCATRLQHALYALEQRLTHLAAGRTVAAANNPIGPRQLSLSFGEAIRPFDIDLQVRLIVLKLFERHVLSSLEPLYDECNALLVAGRILPNLRYSAAIQRQAAPPRREASLPRQAQEAQQALDDVGQQLAAQPDNTDHQILSLVTELRSLLAARHASAIPPAGTASALAGSTSASVPNLRAGTPGPGELLNALSLMQGQLCNAPLEPNASPVADASMVKRQLLDTLRNLGGNAIPGQMGADEDTIDLVGMMFDYALQDRNLPAPIQALLARLQIPYLKIALLDREFIAQREHPARKLLDQLADACVGWSEESDKDRRLYNKVRDTVTTLLREFDEDPSVFKRQSDDFADFVDKNRKRAELLERRAAEAASGRERLEVAQRTAAHEILSRLSGRNLPASVRELLTRRWSNYLVLTHLRHGEDSPEWRAATRFIDDFAWSVEPKKDENDRLRLREMTPEIGRLLKQGLAATGFHEGHLQELWEEVSTIYHAQTQSTHEKTVAAQPALSNHVAAPADQDALTIRFASSKAGEEVVFKGDAINAPSEPVLDAATLEALDTWLKIARTLKTGTWFEFVKDDGSRERAKLLWISTIKALYLFVNRNGLKIAEKTATELAEELKDQKAVILEQVALVDRALDAILRQLRERSATPSAAAPTPATPDKDGAATGAPATAAPAAKTTRPSAAPAPSAANPKPSAANAPSATNAKPTAPAPSAANPKPSAANAPGATNARPTAPATPTPPTAAPVRATVSARPVVERAPSARDPTGSGKR